VENLVELKPLSELKKVIEKAISESTAIPTAKPPTPTTPRPLREVVKK